jgi:uncharacterized membrane-anchored protein
MATAISDIELYETLKAPLGVNGAKTLVNFVEGKVENGFQARLDTFATKKDIAVLKQDITELRADLEVKMSQLEVRMSQMESRIIKWMFIFWIGQIATLIAIMKLL